MNDNLRCNQKMFSLFHATFQSLFRYSVKHPIDVNEYEKLFLLSDPVHLIKSL